MFVVNKDNILIFLANNKAYRTMLYYYDELNLSIQEAEIFLSQFGIFKQIEFAVVLYIDENKLDCVDYLNSLVIMNKLIK